MSYKKIAVSHNTANTNADRPKPTCHHCEKPGHYRNQSRLLKKQREQTENSPNIPGNKNSDANTSNPNSNVTNHNNIKNSNRAKRKLKTVYPPCETCGKTNHSTENCYYGANAVKKDRLPGKEDLNDKLRSNKKPTKMNQMKLFMLQPKI